MATNRKAWTDVDRQRFTDGQRNKAQTFVNRKRKKNRDACRNFRWQG